MIGICIDCGKEFDKKAPQQIRCKECQVKHRREQWKVRYWSEKTSKDVHGAVIRDGHPQICEYTKSCFYGGRDGLGCSYLLETGRSRVNEGHYIVDGKCDAYEPKGGRRMKRQKRTFYFGRRVDNEEIEEVDTETDIPEYQDMD